MISDRSQGNVAARLRYGGLFSCHVTFDKVTGEKVDCLVCPVRLAVILLRPKDEELAR